MDVAPSARVMGYASEYHQVDELRAAPTRVSSGLSDRGRPATLGAR